MYDSRLGTSGPVKYSLINFPRFPGHVRTQKLCMLSFAKLNPNTNINIIGLYSLVPRRSFLARTTWREISSRHPMAYREQSGDLIRWRHDIWRQVESSEREENPWVPGCGLYRLNSALQWRRLDFFYPVWTSFYWRLTAKTHPITE